MGVFKIYDIRKTILTRALILQITPRRSQSLGESEFTEFLDVVLRFSEKLRGV